MYITSKYTNRVNLKSKTSYRYKGGYHKVNPNIFEELEHNGIRVDDHLSHFKYFALYDFESILDPLKDKSGNKLKWTHKHIPVSVSVSSNVPGFTEPKCVINSEPSSLVKSLLEYLHNISDRSYSLHKATLQHILNEIETKKDEFEFKNEQLLSCFNIPKNFKKLFKMEEEISSDIQDNDDDPDVGTDGESVYKRLDKKLINVFYDGYDGNALYLYAIGKDLPVDFFIKRVVDDDFLPHQNSNSYTDT